MISSLQLLDIKLLNFIKNNCRNSMLDKMMPIITSLGNLGLIWVGISAYLLKSRLYRYEGLMILSALILTTFIGEGIIKNLIRRVRPFSIEQADSLLICKPLTYSFPSGHSASSFAAAGIFIMTNSPLSIYAVVLAALIAFSRLYLNVHYPSDVFSGIILGLICSNIIISVFSRMAYSI